MTHATPHAGDGAMDGALMARGPTTSLVGKISMLLMVLTSIVYLYRMVHGIIHLVSRFTLHGRTDHM
jgi:hypothetical protein